MTKKDAQLMAIDNIRAVKMAWSKRCRDLEDDKDILLEKLDLCVEALTMAEKAIIHIISEHNVARAHGDLCDALGKIQQTITLVGLKDERRTY